ncbi:MAG: hypothetical protein PUF51_01085 [Bifidobacteriaceae bacterium]|nr:hypothetical protein [Bifidobacteriaceae bacterium]
MSVPAQAGLYEDVSQDGHERPDGHDLQGGREWRLGKAWQEE